MNKGGFSWKRLAGVTRVKSSVSRAIGVPLTKSGRQRKLGRIVTGGGCALSVLCATVALAALSVVAFTGCTAPSVSGLTDPPAATEAAPEMVTVPDFVTAVVKARLSGASAKSDVEGRAAEAGLKIEWAEDPGMGGAGDTQSPVAGARVSKGTTVKVTLFTGE